MLFHKRRLQLQKQVHGLIYSGLIVLLGIFSNDAIAQSTITGKVVNESGNPLHLAHVMIVGTSNGGVTDKKGRFEFQTNLVGKKIVRSTMVGYEANEKQVVLDSADHVEVTFQLAPKKETLKGATVTASGFTTGDAEGVTLSPTEVVTTPSAAADIFRALKTMPGVSNLDEGSGLFVRGGDVSEVSFVLDQATVVHPYKYESPTGGGFGTIPPFLVSGTYFSTGGFSAKYGNALSAVLAMESKGLPKGTQLDANIGMAALSAGGAIELIPNKLGVNFSGNRSLTDFMFEVNGMSNEFKRSPSGTDGNLSLIAKPYAGTTLKFFSYASENKLGVEVPEPSFDAIFSSEEQNRMHNLQWKQLWGEWLIKTSVSVNRFKSEQQYGGLEINLEDRYWKARSDIEFYGSKNITWYGGVEWIRFANAFDGLVPEDDGVVDPGGEYSALDDQFATERIGGYLEADVELSERLSTRVGMRTDYENFSEDWTMDPRFSVYYALSQKSDIRLAVGRYHQYAEPFQYTTASGNPDLGTQQAWHYIAGYEFQQSLWNARVEVYYKSYDDLIIEDDTENLSNHGYGEAYGVDVFLKYSDFLRTPFNGWISYSFLQSKRLHPRQNAGRNLKYDYAPSAFDITHNLNVVAKKKIIGMLTGGVTYRYSTGRPFTPIVGAEEQSGGYYLPVEGAVHSKRLPNFHRLDLNLSYYWMPAQGWSVIFYSSVSNLLNRKNVMDYTYNQDYSSREPINSNYSRFYYAGATINVNL